MCRKGKKLNSTDKARFPSIPGTVVAKGIIAAEIQRALIMDWVFNEFIQNHNLER